jgi:penicillin-binding protein 1C
MWNVTGVAGAAPVWVEIMSRLHRGVPSLPPLPPAGISRERLVAGEGDAGRYEVFLRGTETTSLAPSAARANFRIVYPAAGTVIALDPDIPHDDQRIFFEAQPESTGLRWLLDGNDLGLPGSLRLWKPERGRHRLTLADASGRTLDAVEFEVRGSLRDQTR